MAVTESAIPENLLSDVGSFSAAARGGAKPSRFTNFSREKKPGVVRVGAFGDSFTFLDEPAPDFPSILQEIIATPRVEVLNFGNHFHGFHQAFRIWDELGSAYGIDVVLLGPGCFQQDRDEGFANSFEAMPYYLHGRYILDGEGVRFVPVPGGLSLTRRFENYVRLIPHPAYRQFDTRAPAFLRHLEPVLGRKFSNPFYYRADGAQEEVHESYRRLIKRMAERSRLVVVLNFEGPIVRLAKTLAPNIVSAVFPSVGFPYRSCSDHLNENGNYLVAQVFGDALGGRSESRISVMQIKPLTMSEPGRSEKKFEQFELRMNGLRIAVPIEATERGCFEFRPADLDAGSVVWLRSPGTPRSEGALAPLEASLKAGDPMILEAEGRSRELGRIRPLLPGTNVYELVSDGLHWFRNVLEVGFSKETVQGWGFGSVPRGIVKIGNQIVFDAHPSSRMDGMALTPRGRPFAIWSPPPDAVFRDAPLRGTIDLVLTSADKVEKVLPIDQFERTSKTIAFDLPEPSPNLYRQPGATFRRR